MNDLRICVVCSKVFRTDLTTCPDDGTPLAIESEQPRTLLGSVLGSYRLVRALGAGGAGAVYEGEHVRLGRRMAIKLLHADITNDEMVTRFFNEARAVNEIRHPNIIDIEDFVSAPTGEHYMVMELLEGEDLRNHIAREGTLSPQRVTAIGVQIAAALAAVHRVGIVHRDLKPENIFLSRDHKGEAAKLLDFGVAKFTNDAQGVTRIGMTIGTPAYMAPEQIVTDGVAGPRSDIYALGMVMYEALTGRPAFVAPAIGQVLRAHCSEAVVPPSQRRGEAIPAVLEAAILKCLAKDAANRFANCDALRAALLSDQAVEVVSLPPAPTRRSRWRMLVELPVAIAATAALVVQIGSQTDPAAAATRPDASVPVVAPSMPPVAARMAPAPAAPAPAPKPVQMTVVLQSQPEHAQLFLGEERKPLGEAPVTITVPQSAELVTLVARFSDGTEVVQRIMPDRELPAIVFAEPPPPPVITHHVARPAHGTHPAAVKSKSHTGGGPGGRDETVDPFTFK